MRISDWSSDACSSDLLYRPRRGRTPCRQPASRGAAQMHAEQAARVKTDFVAHVSHELRTPLNAVIGFGEVLEKQIFGPLGHPKYAEYARDIRESGQHLLSLINDVLDLSKIEAGRMELHREEIGRASWRERVCKYVLISVVTGS